MNAARDRELFEEKRVTSAVFRLAFPTVIGQIILVIYNMADTFFVGLTGNDAMLAAVTVCMPAFMFLSAISNLFGVGAASVIARAMGARETDRAKKTSAFAFWGCLAVTALYSLGAYLFRDVFMDLLGGTNPQVHRNAVEYLTCTVVSGPKAAPFTPAWASLSAGCSTSRWIRCSCSSSCLRAGRRWARRSPPRFQTPFLLSIFRWCC